MAEGVRLSQTAAAAREALEEAKRELQEVQEIRQRARSAEEAAREAAREQIDGKFARFEEAIEQRKKRVAELKLEAEELGKEAQNLWDEAAKVQAAIGEVRSRKKDMEKVSRMCVDGRVTSVCAADLPKGLRACTGPVGRRVSWCNAD